MTSDGSAWTTYTLTSATGLTKVVDAEVLPQLTSVAAAGAAKIRLYGRSPIMCGTTIDQVKLTFETNKWTLEFAPVTVTDHTSGHRQEHTVQPR